MSIKFEDLSIDQKKSLYIKCKSRYENHLESPLTDEQYDALEVNIEAEDPQWPPLLQAGWKVNEHSPLEKLKHKGFMGSIFNLKDYAPKTLEESARWAAGFQSWFTNVKGTFLTATLKVDGLSVAAEYKDGHLVSAITRGDCIEGENVTHHAVVMSGLPMVIPDKSHIVVRGEVVLPLFNWDKFKAAYPEAKNPRNAAAGIMGRKDVKDTPYLKFYAHFLEVLELAPNSVLTEESCYYVTSLKKLDDYDFSHVPCEPIATFDEALAYFNIIADQRAKNQLAYEIDGIVFIVNNMTEYRQLGVDSGRCPRGAAAWKFDVQTGTATLLDVEVTVGHSGVIAPTAILSPVELGGVTVTRASLANYDEIKRLDVALGETVTVSRQGDVIPKVLGRQGDVVFGYQKGDLICRGRWEIVPPKSCPVCDGKIGRKKNINGEDGVHFYCLNHEGCPAQNAGKILKWTKDTNMMNVGEAVIQAMGDAKLVNNPADLYRVGANDLMGMKFRGSTFGEKRARKVVDSINLARNLTLPVFLGALGIPGLGAGIVENVCAKAPGEFDSLTDWLNPTKLTAWKDRISLPNTAESIATGIKRASGLITDLLSAGVVISAPERSLAPTNASGALSGMTFCLTGGFPDKKKVYEEQIVAAGGQVEDDVRSNVTHVVIHEIPADDKLTGKAKKARSKGLTLLSLVDLMGIMQGSRVIEAAHTAGAVDIEDDGYPA